MPQIATYVFMDLETSGLPHQEINKTKITEISMIAVKRKHVLETRPGTVPRVQNKLTLCMNPRKLIQPDGTLITGLSNELLEDEVHFNHEVFCTINNFLNILAKPVCLIAQNGLNFDYPILKRHLDSLKVSFADDLTCADCFHAFYDILNDSNKEIHGTDKVTSAQQKPDMLMLEKDFDMKTINEKTLKVISADHLDNVKSDLLALDNCLDMKHINEKTLNVAFVENSEYEKSDLHILENCLDMKSINENTPKRSLPPITKVHTPKKSNKGVNKARRRFPWSQGNKPKESYKLKNIYERLLNRPALEAHRAENDVILAMECSVVLKDKFVKWVDENYILFDEIKPMTIGVPLGL